MASAYSQQSTANKPQSPSFRDLFIFTSWRTCWLLVAGLVSAILVGALEAAMSILPGKIFSIISSFGSGHLTGEETMTQVSGWCVLLAVIGGAGFFVNFAFLFSWIVFGESQARSIRGSVFRGLLNKDMGWFDIQQDGIASLLIRIQTQTRELQIASSVALGSLISDLATSVASIIVALYTAWRLTLVLLASVPISAVVIALLGNPIKPAIQAQKKELSRASKYAFSAISAIDLVKVFNGIDHETWQYVAAIRRSMESHLIQARASACQLGYVKFWIDSLFVIGFYYGTVLVGQEISPGDVLTTFYATLTAIQAVDAFVPVYLVLAKGMSAAQDLRSVSYDIENGRKISRMMGGYVPRGCKGDIEMRDISFAYPSNPSKLVLQKSSFRFRAGELCFVTGKSGSGKSTLGNLLVKFYEPLSGEILIDGTAVRILEIGWLRKNVTLIQQSSILFNDTFFMNVAFGHMNPTKVSVGEVKAACETALLQSTISNLPGGMETNVGTGGHNLSGGQKQRLALARARLRDPPVLILDEVTSGLDHISRVLIMEAIRKWRRGKTTIIITHEISQIQDQDFVYVLNEGRVVQEGSFRDLRQQRHGMLAYLREAAAASESSEGHSAMSAKIRQRVSSTVNFSRPLSDASQNNPLVPGSPSPGEAIRGVPFSSHDVFRMARRNSPLRLLGDHRRHHIDTSGTLNALATAAENSPGRGVSKIMASLGQQFPSVHISIPRQSVTWNSSDHSLTRLPSIERISIIRLQELGDAVQISRHGFTSSAAREQGEINHTQTGLGRGRQMMTQAVQDKNPVIDSEPVAALSLGIIYKTVWVSLELKGKIYIVAGAVTSLVLAGSVPAFSVVFANLLGALYKKENRREAGQKWALVLLGIAISSAIAAFSSRYLLEWAGQAWVNNLRKQAFNRILHQPKIWFEGSKHSAGRINECLDRNAEEMRNLVGRVAPLILVVGVMFLSSVIWALAISWKLTLVSLASVPFLIAATNAYSVVANRWETRCDHAAAETSAIAAETFNNVRVVRALTLEGFFRRKHDKSAQNTYYLGINKAVLTATLYAIWQSMFWFMMALIFWYATVLLAVKEELTVQAVLQVVNLLVLGLSAASKTLNSVPTISAAQTAASQLLYYAHLPLDSSHESEGTKVLAHPFPIHFSGLYFAYPSRRDYPVLRNLTLSFEAGVSTALVGPSGCGKSTIASLILGLHISDTLRKLNYRGPQPLTFAFVPMPQIDKAKLRAQIGYVPQTPYLFPACIAENIAYGLPEDSPLRRPDNIEQAAHEAGIHDFICSLPDGYGTLVGDGGQVLSGGQSQRLCIARALARRPRVLVLDEPTSALDAASTEGIKRTIQSLLSHKRGTRWNNFIGINETNHKHDSLCVIIITHNQEMMRMADRIALIDMGRVVESGTYRELSEKKGKFAELISGGAWMGNRNMKPPQEQLDTWSFDSKDAPQAKRATDLPLRQNSKETDEEVSPRTIWIGWTPGDGPTSTGMLSPMASPFSQMSRRREHGPNEDV